MNPGPTMRARRRLLACALALPVVLGIAPVARADLVSTLARVKPSVVAVGTYQRTRSPAFVFRGTGFAIDDGMLVATNAHVLPEEVDGARMEGLVIVLPGDDLTGAVRPVRVVATERGQDLALLRLESGPPLPALRLAAGRGVVEGQEVAFTGFPIGAVLGMTPADGFVGVMDLNLMLSYWSSNKLVSPAAGVPEPVGAWCVLSGTLHLMTRRGRR